MERAREIRLQQRHRKAIQVVCIALTEPLILTAAAAAEQAAQAAMLVRQMAVMAGQALPIAELDMLAAAAQELNKQAERRERQVLVAAQALQAEMGRQDLQTLAAAAAALILQVTAVPAALAL